MNRLEKTIAALIAAGTIFVSGCASNHADYDFEDYTIHKSVNIGNPKNQDFVIRKKMDGYIRNETEDFIVYFSDELKPQNITIAQTPGISTSQKTAYTLEYLDFRRHLQNINYENTLNLLRYCKGANARTCMDQNIMRLLKSLENHDNKYTSQLLEKIHGFTYYLYEAYSKMERFKSNYSEYNHITDTKYNKYQVSPFQLLVDVHRINIPEHELKELIKAGGQNE